MHHRLPVWLFLCAFAAFVTARAQTPAATTAAPLPSQPGQISAAKVTGTVTVKIADQTKVVHNGDFIEQTATVITALNSSVVLVFSNGATTPQLGPDTVLSIDKFLQDPFADTQTVATMTEEPTRSTTRLHLTKGELVGKVVHLKHDQGSTFIVQTPVGAAGIRGTTFRIVFRPQGTGLAFFALSTVEGNVNFTQPGQNQAGNGANPGGGNNGNGNGNGNGGNGNGNGGNGSGNGNGGGNSGGNGGGGVSVAQGQEVVVTVTVNTNAAGVVVVTTAPTVTASIPISAAAQAAVTQAAVQIATAAASVTFTAPPPPPSAPTNTGGTTGSTTGTTTTDTTTNNGNSNSNNNNSNNNNSNNGNSNNNNSNGNNLNANNTPPSVTTPPPHLTPGDGR